MARHRSAGWDEAGWRDDSAEANLIRLFILAALHENDPASAGLMGARAYAARDGGTRYPQGVFVDWRV
jgi:hypothetical protein